VEVSVIGQMTTAAGSEIYWENSVPVCPDCGNDSEIITDEKHGRSICGSCGMVVVEQLIMDESEWRNFSNDKSSDKKDRNRVGGPASGLHDEHGVSTVIEKTGSGAALSKLQNQFTMNRQQQAIIEGYDLLQNFADMMALGSSITTRAKEIFRAVMEIPAFKARDRKALVTACLFFACRQANVERMIKELCQVTDADPKTVGNLLGKIKRTESVLPLLKRAKGPSLTAASPAQYMIRFCGQLKLDANFSGKATEVAERLEKKGLLVGRNPATRSAICIHVLCAAQKDSPCYRSEKEICDVTGIAEQTLRKAYKDILQHVPELLESVV